MTQAATIRFGKSAILLGDGESDEMFTAPCGFEQLNMQINIASNSVAVPDCADPDLAAWLETDIVSKQMVLSGNGVLDLTAMQTWQAWWFNGGDDGEEKNVRFFRNLTLAQGGGYFQAPGRAHRLRGAGAAAASAGASRPRSP